MEIHGLDSAVGMAFGKLGLAMWTVPAVAMGVPGLLVLVVSSSSSPVARHGYRSPAEPWAAWACVAGDVAAAVGGR